MATTVVKQVVAEVRGKTDQLDRELAVAEQRIGRTKKAIEGNAAAVGSMGNQYAGAARQIASATENISRAGGVTGEAAKQILFSGSQIAFAFGTGGAVVGALSVFALAAVQAFQKSREEMDETAKKAEETIDRLLNAGDGAGLRKRAQELFLGTAADRDEEGRLAPFTRGIKGLREEIAKLQDVSTLNAFNFLPRQERIAELRAELEPLEAEFAKVREAALALQTLPDLTSGAITTTAQSVKAAAKETADASKAITAALADASRAIAEYDKEVTAFGTGFESLVLSEIGTSVEQLTAKFDDLIAQGTAVEGTNSPRVQQLVALRDSAVQAAAAIADSERTLSDLELAAARGAGADVTVFGRLAEDAARLTAELARLKPGTQAYAAVQAQLLKVERERAKLLDGVGASGDGTAAATRSTADLAREIQQAVDGALQLAGAFGDVNASVINVLRSIGQIAGNLPGFVDAVGTLNRNREAGTLTGGTQLGVLSTALPIAGALVSLFRDSPAEQARREALRKNTDAIRELTAKAGLLGINVTGTQGAQASAVVAEVLRRTAGAAPGRKTLDLGGVGDLASEQFGITFAELQRIAQSLGVTLDNSRESFEAFRDALDNSITKLGEFGTDLASQLQQAQAEIDLFGITDPAEQLRIRNQATAGRSPALDRVLAGLDLNTAEGRAQARLNAQALFDVIKAGGDRLTDADLGGLNGDELLRAILSLVTSLNDVDESLGLNTSTATQTDQAITSDRTQITVDQASRLLGLAASQLTELRIIRQALTAATTPLALPGPGVFGGGGGGTTLTINQTIEINGNVTDGAAIAQQSMDAIVEYVRRALGNDVRVRRRYAGEAVIS